VAVDSLVVVVVVSLAGLDDLDDVGCTLTHEKRGHVLQTTTSSSAPASTGGSRRGSDVAVSIARPGRSLSLNILRIARIVRGSASDRRRASLRAARQGRESR
jgi:hypothetical protein